jgi:hypothetical protein
MHPQSFSNLSSPLPRPTTYALKNTKSLKRVGNLFLIAALSFPLSITPSHAQPVTVNQNAISISSLTSYTYTQNFDSLIKSGSATITSLNTTALRGLQIAYSGGSGTSATNIIADNGTMTGGSIYSYVTSGGTNTRFGTLTTTTSTGDIYYGFRFVNDTGNAISEMSISFQGEIWRVGQANFAETLEFSSAVFNTGSGSLGAAGYTIAESGLQYANINGSSTGSQASSLAATRENKFGTVTFAAPVASGQEVWIQWKDQDVAGADHGIGIDNLNVTFTTSPLDPTPAPPAAVSVLIGCCTFGLPLAGARWRNRCNLRKKKTGRKK